MNLHDLFQEAIGDLAPGEKRSRPEFKVRDLRKIEQRIGELEDALYNNRRVQQQLLRNPDVLKKLDAVKDTIQRKIDLLQRFKEKPIGDTNKLFDILDQECSEFISAMKQANKMLYRGTKSEESVFEGRSYDDPTSPRRTKDSNKEISDQFDEMLSQMGVKALRSNSIYTTSSEGFASQYGWNVYIIFPKNGFSFLGTRIRDLILNDWWQIADQEKLMDLMKRLDEWGKANVPGWISTNLVGRQLYYTDYQEATKYLLRNFAQGNNLNLPEEYNINIQDYVTPQSIRENFEPNTTNLADAIENGNELLIRGEYWALKKRDWFDAVNRRYFGGSVSIWE